MYTDPQSVTIDASPVSLPRVSTQGRTSIYESADGALTLTISHVNNKRTRSVARLDRRKTSTDPLNPSTMRPYSMSTYLVIDTPLNVGFTDAEIESDAQGLIDLVGAEGFLTKFLGQES